MSALVVSGLQGKLNMASLRRGSYLSIVRKDGSFWWFGLFKIFSQPGTAVTAVLMRIVGRNQLSLPSAVAVDIHNSLMASLPWLWSLEIAMVDIKISKMVFGSSRTKLQDEGYPGISIQ